MAVPCHTPLKLSTDDVTPGWICRYVDHGSSYNSAVWGELQPRASTAIAQALQLQTPDSRRQSPRLPRGDLEDHCSSTVLPLWTPHFEGRQRLESLQRLFTALAKWHPGLGYNSHFAQFSALVMAVTLKIRATFLVATGVYKECDLDRYYITPPPVNCRGGSFISGPAEAKLARDGLMLQDVDLVWQELEVVWPMVTAAFTKFRQERRFFRLVRSWLLTLMASGFSPEHQPLEDFLPLFSRVIVPSGGGHASRAQLRCIAVSILGRHCKAFSAALKAADKSKFNDIVTGLESHIHVDKVLIDLIDCNVSPWRFRDCSVALAASSGGTLGTLLGFINSCSAAVTCTAGVLSCLLAAKFSKDAAEATVSSMAYELAECWSDDEDAGRSADAAADLQ